RLDFPRFGTSCLDQECIEIFSAHCIAVSYTCQVSVFFNGMEFKISDIFEYAKLFFTLTKSSAVMYKDPNNVYDICLVDTPDSAITISFVNGMLTSNGGAHVDSAYKVITEAIIAFLGGAVEGVRITKRDIDRHVSLFLSCRLVNPQFKSQIKDCLAKPSPKIEIPEDYLKPIKKWNMLELLYKDIQRKQIDQLKKTDGKTGTRVKDSKAIPANFSGSDHRHMQTTLILVEGDSADNYAFKFISRFPNRSGKDYFGVVPLKGKLLNVMNADFLQILNNKEIKSIKKHLGLKEEIDYKLDINFNKLNYGGVLILPDADNDGKHILGLVLLFFIYRFYDLVARGFIRFLRVPVIRCLINGQQHSFYSMSRYNRVTGSLPPGIKATNVEYFKGLGSSSDKHIIEDYNNPRIVKFILDQEACNKIILAFKKTEANNRKKWLADWVTREVIETDDYTELPISLFIDHEFIDYSIENVIRGIPEALDGFKDAQRKAFFACSKIFSNKKKDKIKTARASARAAEITCYKHGEGCLADTISLMTQKFTGSNNMPYFEGEGQFGEREKGTKHFSNPRYTHIKSIWWSSLIYIKEDKRLERLIIDEGEECECETFFPILPMHLINGVLGIGTAYSTNIPSYNPLDIAFWLHCRLKGYSLPIVKPWYKGFTGQVVINKDGFFTEGNFTYSNGAYVVNELPIGTWYVDYDQFLNELQEQKVIDRYDNHCTDEGPQFEIYGFNDGAPSLKKLRLVSKHSYSNMTVLYRTANRGICPRTYKNVNDMLEDFYLVRLPCYNQRKTILLDDLDKEIHTISERKRFIIAVAVERSIEIRNRQESLIYSDMDRQNFNHDLLDKVKSREFTLERVQSLEDKLGIKEIERNKLSQVSAEEMWYNEIEEFINKYTSHEKCNRSTYDSCNPVITINLN
ncbi:MAG: DNA gyrase subunit A, partial [Acidimicrobiales bacterium]